jgi:hypothetical protein
MSTLLFQMLEVAAILGALLLVVALILSASRTYRPWAIAVLCGGVLGAGLGVGLWLLFGHIFAVGREVTISDVTVMLASAAFGMGGSLGAAVCYLADLFQANVRRHPQKNPRLFL